MICVTVRDLLEENPIASSESVTRNSRKNTKELRKEKETQLKKVNSNSYNQLTRSIPVHPVNVIPTHEEIKTLFPVIDQYDISSFIITDRTTFTAISDFIETIFNGYDEFTLVVIVIDAVIALPKLVDIISLPCPIIFVVHNPWKANLVSFLTTYNLELTFLDPIPFSVNLFPEKKGQDVEIIPSTEGSSRINLGVRRAEMDRTRNSIHHDNHKLQNESKSTDPQNNRTNSNSDNRNINNSTSKQIDESRSRNCAKPDSCRHPGTMEYYSCPNCVTERIYCLLVARARCARRVSVRYFPHLNDTMRLTPENMFMTEPDLVSISLHHVKHYLINQNVSLDAYEQRVTLLLRRKLNSS